MLELKLDKIDAMYTHFNGRTEREGDKDIPAADLKVTAYLPATVLEQFRTGLKDMLFKHDTLEGTLFAGDEDVAKQGLVVRDPHMVYPLERDEEMTGATVSIDFGIGDPMVFGGVKVNSFKLTPRDGGSVVVDFRVQCRPDQDQGGKLYWLQKRSITFSLTPMEPPKLAEAA